MFLFSPGGISVFPCGMCGSEGAEVQAQWDQQALYYGFVYITGLFILRYLVLVECVL